MTGDPQYALARTLVDEWVRNGVGLAALAPGSRSTPLALALDADPRVRVEVFLDERSAAFFGVGAGRASGRPAVVLCTSGTAAANFHPAVLEAWHGRVPLVVATADRPPELRDTGAGQVADQIKLFGSSVRWFCEVGTADRADPSYWRSVACRSVADACGPPPGPVHLNLAFRDPLVPPDEGGVDAGRSGPGGRPWTTTTVGRAVLDEDEVDGLAARVAATPRGLVVAGWGAGVGAAAVERFAAAAGWPVLADPISGVRSGPLAISAYDALLRVPEVAGRLRPDLVLHVGAALTGKVATAWLDAGVPRVVVDPDRAWLDPHRSASERVVADAAVLLEGLAERLEAYGPAAGSPWVDAWLGAEAEARAALDGFLDAGDEPSEARTARDLVAGLPAGASLVVGSSMPVRDVEAFARPRRGLRFHSNRGVNGIDGFVATVLGVAAAGDGPVVALCGDLTFLHDGGGLLDAARRGLDATFVVVDNRGGGIFSFLPQAGLPAGQFEALWGTPHHLDLVELCRVHGIGAVRVDRAPAVVPAVAEAIEAGGVRAVVVPTDRAANVAHHRRAHAEVAARISGADHRAVDLP